MKNNKYQMALALIIMVICSLTLGYAALTQTLNINFGATVQSGKTTWDIHFESTNVNPVITGVANSGTVDLQSTTITITNLLFKKSGDSVVYNFKVVNDGEVDAKISVITPLTVTVTGGTEAEQTALKNGIEYTLKYADGKVVKLDDTLASKEEKIMNLTINLKENTQLPTSNVTISNIGYTLTYVEDNNTSSDVVEDKTLGYAVNNLLNYHYTYNYMNGTYIKGGNLSGRDTLYAWAAASGYDETTVMSTFFDSEGNFLLDVYEQYSTAIALQKNLASSEEGWLKYLSDRGYVNNFQYMTGSTPEVILNMPAVDNNYIIFNGLTWRIMGKNADGSIRLITEDVVETMNWSTSSNDTYANSAIKNWVNTSFLLQLTNDENIVNTSFCEDNVDFNYQMGKSTCSVNSSARAGLISYGEYTLSGLMFSYLINGEEYWTSTTSVNGIQAHVVKDGEATLRSKNNESAGVRVIISISSDVEIIDGDGTAGNAYQI